MGLLLLFSSSLAKAQNINLNFPTMCPPSTQCNPFLNGGSCGQGVSIRTTHGSPQNYVSVINGIEFRAELSTSNSLQYGEGLTFGYPFTAGKLYTIRLKHQGIPNTQAIPYPYLIAGFTNNPPRNNDGCSLGYLPGVSISNPVSLTVSTGQTTSSFDFAPTETFFNLWVYSAPLSFGQAGFLLVSLEIIDHGTAPGGATCYQDASFNFCDPSRVWNGSTDVRAVNPLTIGCDAFKTSSAPGAGAAFVRRFTAPTITLSPGFVASANDPAGAVRTLKIIPSTTPCSQPLRVETPVSPISNFKNEKTSEDQVLENIQIYPSPSRGLVNVNLNQSELLNADITVADQSGRIVYQARNKSAGKLVQLNLQHLSNGIYFIKVKAKDKTAVKKLLISK